MGIKLKGNQGNCYIAKEWDTKVFDILWQWYRKLHGENEQIWGVFSVHVLKLFSPLHAYLKGYKTGWIKP